MRVVSYGLLDVEDSKWMEIMENQISDILHFKQI